MSDTQMMVRMARHVLEDVWRTPSAIDASRFVGQEAGEVDSALMKLGYQDGRYARSNPVEVGTDAAWRDVELEMGQCLMMLATLSNEVGINLDKALERALEKAYASFGKGNGHDAKWAEMISIWRRYQSGLDTESRGKSLAEIIKFMQD